MFEEAVRAYLIEEGMWSVSDMTSKEVVKCLEMHIQDSEESLEDVFDGIGIYAKIINDVLNIPGDLLQ